MSGDYREIRTFYDNLYATREDVWSEVGGRGPGFTEYLATLIEELAPKRHLDVGCGEGGLLNAVSASLQFGAELSRTAITVARAHTTASFCQAIAEQLPYRNGCFDVVSSVGVMPHLLDDLSGTKEICRVLHDNGHYVAALFMPIPFSERVWLKIAEYVSPSFRPVALFRWMVAKLRRRPRDRDLRLRPALGHSQPVQHPYTPRKLERIFTLAGFKQVRLITKRLVPEAPLAADTFRIYVLRKATGTGC